MKGFVKNHKKTIGKVAKVVGLACVGACLFDVGMQTGALTARKILIDMAATKEKLPMVIDGKNFNMSVILEKIEDVAN